MSETDRSYFQARAEQELRMAEDAKDCCAARAHSLLAGFYLDRIHGAASSDASDHGDA